MDFMLIFHMKKGGKVLVKSKERCKEGVFCLQPGICRLSRITASHNSNTRKRERRKDEMKDVISQHRSD